MNVGSIDRSLRFVLGVMLLASPFVSPTAEMIAPWGLGKYGVIAFGFILFGTALFRFCPAYTLFGIRTCAINKQ